MCFMLCDDVWDGMAQKTNVIVLLQLLKSGGVYALRPLLAVECLRIPQNG